mmetsp:Transcript_80717/g.237209  ORF Transcript_80717/g.237209 Transcript_80717/m.237209 type:complete len:584 (+) Transcript_80717:82-1833(+)
MGGAAASLRRPKKKVSHTQVSVINEHYEDDLDVDYTIGFNFKAAEQYGWGGNPSGESRTESDEFRVLRVSSLSGQVTLYVAGGKHTKPVQYALDRACPRAEEQPPHSDRCPFCPGSEAKTPPSVLCFDCNGVEELTGDPGSNWSVRVFPNIFPMLICPVAFYGKAHKEALSDIPHSVVAAGLHSNNKVRREGENHSQLQVDAIGASEVVVESPRHNALLALQEPVNICLALKALAARGRALSKQPWAKQLLFFKQYGPLSGGSLVHPHMQVVSLPVLPPPLVSRLEHSLYIHSSQGRCATCCSCVDPFVRNTGKTNVPTLSSNASLGSAKTVGLPPVLLTPRVITPNSPNTPGSVCEESNAEATASSRLVHITEHFVVSVPYASSSQYSMTVAPRRHSAHFQDATPEELADLSRILALLAQALYHGLDDPSYNIFIRTAPSATAVRARGREVSQDDISACFHWILEFRPRFPADLGGFEIASGVRVVSGLPEDHAAELRSWVKARLEDNVQPVRPLPPQRISSRIPSKNSFLAREELESATPGRAARGPPTEGGRRRPRSGRGVAGSGPPARTFSWPARRLRG